MFRIKVYLLGGGFGYVAETPGGAPVEFNTKAEARQYKHAHWGVLVKNVDGEDVEV